MEIKDCLSLQDMMYFTSKFAENYTVALIRHESCMNKLVLALVGVSLPVFLGICGEQGVWGVQVGLSIYPVELKRAVRSTSKLSSASMYICTMLAKMLVNLFVIRFAKKQNTLSRYVRWTHDKLWNQQAI